MAKIASSFKKKRFGSIYPLMQACQTQTALRAAKGTKTAEGAAKVLK